MGQQRDNSGDTIVNGPASAAPLSEVRFGDALRRVRRAAGLTQEALAARAGISTRTVSDLERGVIHHPQRETLRLLVDALGLDARAAVTLEAIGAGVAPPVPVMPVPAPVVFPVTSGSIADGPVPADNLPAPVTPLIGREDDLRDALALLGRGTVRLLTVTGPGGIGKTRFALDLAATARAAFADGVCFVSLAPVREGDDLVPALAGALGVREVAGQSLREGVFAALRPRHLLLVLDNFEQLAAEAPAVSDLLAACSRLMVLVTSRAVLRVRGEYEFALPALPVPTAAMAGDLAALGANAAVRLFAERAEAARRGFALTAENAAAVAAICARLEGIPLALELAAARIRLLVPHALLALLDPSLPQLRDGPRDSPARHRAMAATVAWSYALLTEAEQAVFRRCAVFAGGWTIEAAAAVCDIAGAETAGAAVTEAADTEAATMTGEAEAGTTETAAATGAAAVTLAALVERSLVRVTPGHDGTPRFAQFEVIREYGWEQLAARGERAATQQRHARYFAALAEAADPALRGPDQAWWLDRLETEHDNIRAVLRYLQERREIEAGLRVALGMWRFWVSREHSREGEAWLGAFRSLAEADDTPVSPRTMVRIHRVAGQLAVIQGHTETARDSFTRMLADARSAGDTEGVAAARSQLGHIALRQGDYDRAHDHYTDALRLREPLGNPRNIALSLSGLGQTAMCRGDLPDARVCLLRALAIFRRVGDASEYALVSHYLGCLASRDHRFAEAHRWLAESLTACAALHDWRWVANTLEECAILAVRQGQYARAPRLAGAAATIRTEIQGTRSFWTAAEDTAVRDALGAEAFTAAWEAGAALSCDEAIAEALAPSTAGLAEAGAALVAHR